jgi:hypothetical protein
MPAEDSAAEAGVRFYHRNCTSLRRCHFGGVGRAWEGGLWRGVGGGDKHLIGVEGGVRGGGEGGGGRGGEGGAERGGIWEWRVG